ncbi:MAG: ABC transporter permease [Pseudomonadota bacterium]
MIRNYLPSFILLLVFLTGWEAMVRFTEISSLVVPPPSAVFSVLWDGFTTGFLWKHVWVTSATTVIGFLLGCVIGFVCGVILGEIEPLRRLFWPYILAMQVVPKLALAPIFIIWFGFGMKPTVIITALICFFPLLENTMVALDSVTSEKRQLFRMLGAGRWKTLIHLQIPSGLPVILAGVRVAIVLALVGAVVGEFVTGSEGLGASIIAAQGMMDSSLIFALLITITALGLLLYQLVLFFEYWLLSRRVKGKIH